MHLLPDGSYCPKCGSEKISELEGIHDRIEELEKKTADWDEWRLFVKGQIDALIPPYERLEKLEIGLMMR